MQEEGWKMVHQAMGADYVCGVLRMGWLGESLVAVFTFFGEKSGNSE